MRTPPAPNQKEEQRHRPEDHSQARYRAYQLQNLVTSRKGPGAGAQARDTARNDAPLGAATSALQAGLQTALAHATDDAARAALLSGLAHGARPQVDPEVVSELLAALGQTQFDAQQALRATAWLDLPVLTRLHRGHRRRFIAADLQLHMHSGWKRLSRALMRCEGLAASTPAQQADLLRYAIGPTPAAGAAPLRVQRLQLGWSARRDLLRALLSQPGFRRARPSLQAEMLQDFLHTQDRQVWLLHATALTGHAVIVLGPPDDARALSYGRRFVRTKTGRSKAIVSMPDPTVLSGWSRPAIDAVTRYAAEGHQVSRNAELGFLCWLEANCSVIDDARANPGPRPHRTNPHHFMPAAQDALRFLSGARPTHATVLGGKVLAEPSQGLGTMAMLQAYLSA